MPTAALGLVVVASCGAPEPEGVGPASPFLADGGQAGPTREPPPNGGPNGGPPPGTGPGPNVCERLVVDSQPQPPQVLVVIDRSSSMYDPEGQFGPPADRWTPAVGAVRSVVGNLEDRVNFGLVLYPGALSVPGFGGILGGLGVQLRSCDPGEVVVAPEARAFARIDETLAAPIEEIVGGGTPTGPTLDAAVTALRDLPGERVILLLTDGGPNCNEGLSYPCPCTDLRNESTCIDNGGSCLDDIRTIEAVVRAREQGVRTYVVGFDTAAWAPVLDAMASEGGTGRSSHFPVSSGAELEAALLEVSGRVAISCQHRLEAAPPDINFVRVTAGGDRVPHVSETGDGSGWRLEDALIVLEGDSCEQLRAASSPSLEITVECEPQLI